MNELKRIRDFRHTTAIGKVTHYVVDWVDLNRIAQTDNTTTVYYGNYFDECGKVCARFISSAFEFDCGGYENSRCVDSIYLALYLE